MVLNQLRNGIACRNQMYARKRSQRPPFRNGPDHVITDKGNGWWVILYVTLK